MKDAFDTFHEWANKPLDSMLTIDAELHHAVTSLSREDWGDREKVNRVASETQERIMSKLELPPRIVKFLTENFPADDNLAGYVIGIANRDKTLNVAVGFDNTEVRDKVQKALNEHIALWEGSPDSRSKTP